MGTSPSEAFEPDDCDPYHFTSSAPANNESPARELPPTDNLVESPTRVSLAPPSQDPVPVFTAARQAQIMEWWFEREELLKRAKTVGGPRISLAPTTENYKL